MRTSKCFVTDGSKMEDKPFVGFASIDINDAISRKFRNLPKYLKSLKTLSRSKIS
jgi:hypothetical protein